MKDTGTADMHGPQPAPRGEMRPRGWMRNSVDGPEWHEHGPDCEAEGCEEATDG